MFIDFIQLVSRYFKFLIIYYVQIEDFKFEAYIVILETDSNSYCNQETKIGLWCFVSCHQLSLSFSSLLQQNLGLNLHLLAQQHLNFECIVHFKDLDGLLINFPSPVWKNSFRIVFSVSKGKETNSATSFLVEDSNCMIVYFSLIPIKNG